MNKTYAKISIGMLLVQDVVATFVLLFLSISNSSVMMEGNAISNIALLIGKGFVFFAGLYFISKYLLPKLLNFLAKSQELLFLFSICWGIGLAALFNILGFSIEIGALAAGIAFASSPFSQEVGSRMKPLRDFFILLFFVMLGSQMVLADIPGIIVPAVTLSLFVLIGNPIIVFLIMNFVGHRNRTAFFTGLTVAQISEFSLILVALGSSLGYLNKEFVSLITIVGIITIAGSSYFFIYAEKIYSKLKPVLHFLGIRKSIKNKEEKEILSKDMIIFGYDRVGYDFVKIAKKMNLNYGVVDLNPEAIYKLKKEKVSCYFGDAEDVDFLEEIAVQKARIIVSTIPDFATNMNLVSFYRNHNKDGIIIVISHNIKNTKELYKHGASFVVMPHYLGAKHASQMIENFAFKQEAFEEEKKHHLEYLEERQKKTE
jgi:Trk K+ transport system NAD-binding subunit